MTKLFKYEKGKVFTYISIKELKLKKNNFNLNNLIK